MKCKSPQCGCIGEGVEDEGTSSFWVGDIHITAQGFGSCMGGETSFGSYTKEVYISYLHSPPEPRNAEENKATPLKCESGNLVEEQASKVSEHKDGKMKNMDGKISDFCSSHVHLQPYNTWEDKNSSLASEDYKMKDNCEGDEITPSFSIGDHKTIAKEENVVNGDEGYFLSDPKEEQV